VSGAKRFFDCICVVLMLPILIPTFLAIGLAVRLTSSGPVLFLQKRMGRHGREFTILKFRTMIHTAHRVHQPVTTSGNQLFTPVGPFLRRWKLDEIPQLLNVLVGHMSLVGPRPKLQEHAISNVPCRAGITGAATIAFAREESILDRIPKSHLDSFYHSVVLPAKHQLDEEYMANATFLSDLKLIFDSVMRRWDSSIMEQLLTTWAFEQEDGIVLSSLTQPDEAYSHAAMLAHLDGPASTGEVRAF
jgi:lipopolysaccharide/colanic/teichoic acid biosynthesis glycosyltransferase